MKSLPLRQAQNAHYLTTRRGLLTPFRVNLEFEEILSRKQQVELPRQSIPGAAQFFNRLFSDDAVPDVFARLDVIEDD
jgi:hypothetical protein